MSYILSLYSSKAFKEFLLPAINNANYDIKIQGNLFGFSKDLEIHLENIEGKWRYKKCNTYVITYTITKENYTNDYLKDGDIFSIQSLGDTVSIIVKETDSSFNVYKKYSLININEIGIGRKDTNTFCYDYMHLVSNEHARIQKRGNVFVIEELRPDGNGVFLNSKRIVGSSQLNYGDVIDIFGLRIVFMNIFIAVNVMNPNLKVRDNTFLLFEPSPLAADNTLPSVMSKELFHRSPRNIPKIHTEKIEIEAPPQPKEIVTQPAFMSIGPSLTMALPMVMGVCVSMYASKMTGSGSSAFMYTGLITAISSALIGTVWAIVNMKQTKKKNREDELKRFEAYSEYLIHCANDIKLKYEQNTHSLRQMYPDAASCSSYNSKSMELWSRNSKHEDYLSQRLGIGNLPFQVEIEIPKERFNLIVDSLSEKPKKIKESYANLLDVPICVDLFNDRIWGVVGGMNLEGCYPVMNSLVTQIAANNCYTDVKMAFIYDDSDTKNTTLWNSVKWLPHVWSEDKKTRYVAGNKAEASDVFYEITKVLRMRSEDSDFTNSYKKIIPKPYYILFLEKPELLEGELIAKYIFDTENNLGISTIILSDFYENLPNSCENIIENTALFRGKYCVTDGEEDKTPIRFDATNEVQFEMFARRLSSIEVKEVETGGEIPSVLTFFDMYGVKHLDEFNVLERWRKNRNYDSMKALIGQKAGGIDCYLDVHEKYHGPHGLIAGTTGSGKSETLQTYILSLALNFSPDDIGFFIIDYKGGGMANLFEKLPHMIGQISNLSGNQVRRAMVSIKSENMRRQRIFNEYGVNNINLYTKLYKNKEAKIPIPHMFIIIDEFAELKREEPDFMRELISVAQVGRSLGVHLILATQKPSGTVDDNIWSNSKFRLCLRVQDRQDSNDMLHKADAAYITQAGRCYLQVGNDELFELFQSAYSGAKYDEEAGSVQTNIARMLTENGKASVVGSRTQMKLCEKSKMRWINRLLTVLKSAMQGIEVEEIDSNNATIHMIVNRFFDEVEIYHLEYAKSDYNMHRVEDLLNTYIEVMNEGTVDLSHADEVAKAIIDHSVETNKKLPEMKEKTQLDAVVDYLAKVAVENGYTNDLLLWLPVLPETLYLSSLEDYEKNTFNGEKWPELSKAYTLETIVGLYDDPVNQSQKPVTMDLAEEGNYAIVGTVASGKSTFLMTYLYSLVNRYTPDVVNLYIIDYSSKMLGSLEGLAHVGGVMFENDDEKVAKFFTMLQGMIKERKQMFKGGNYSQYVRVNGYVVPSIVIAIDNMSAFRNKTNNNYDELLLTILKEGVNYGIYVVATAAGFGMSEIPNRMSDNFRRVICLEMNDRYAYTDVLKTLRIDTLPEENVKGRGLVKIGESILEFQTALCLPAEDDFDRGNLIQSRCKEMNSAWEGKWARRIPEIPQKPTWSDFVYLEEVQKLVEKGNRLPIGYDRQNALIYGIDLTQNYCYAVSGKSHTGKTNMLCILINAATVLGGKVTVFDFFGDLKKAAEFNHAEYISTAQGLYDFCMNIQDELSDRNERRKELSGAGRSEQEVFEAMRTLGTRFFIIGDLIAFTQKAHNPGNGLESMGQFIASIMEFANNQGMYWFAGINMDDANKIMGYEVYNAFIKDRKGIHFGGNVAAQSVLTFDYIPYSDQVKKTARGIGLLSSHDEDNTEAVVVPLFTMEDITEIGDDE